jgi:hypothetical protein
MYCATCILHWALHKEEPWCPQCKQPFNFLLTYRSIDGELHVSCGGRLWLLSLVAVTECYLKGYLCSTGSAHGLEDAAICVLDGPEAAPGASRRWLPDLCCQVDARSCWLAHLPCDAF